jgi:hypothetical protein
MSDLPKPAPELPENQLIAIDALARGLKKGEAAAAAGVTRKTLLEWRKDPLFDHAWRKEKQDRWHRATSLMHNDACEIVEKLKAVISHTDSDAVRVRAIDVFLKWCFKTAHQEFIEETVDDLYRSVCGDQAAPRQNRAREQAASGSGVEHPAVVSGPAVPPAAQPGVTSQAPATSPPTTKAAASAAACPASPAEIPFQRDILGQSGTSAPAVPFDLPPSAFPASDRVRVDKQPENRTLSNLFEPFRTVRQKGALTIVRQDRPWPDRVSHHPYPTRWREKATTHARPSDNVSRPLGASGPRGEDVAASIRRQRARVDGMASTCELSRNRR